MHDLSSVMFYNTKFRIKRVDSDTDLLWLIVLHIRNWMTHKYNKKGVNCIPTDLRKWSSFKIGKPVFSFTNFPYDDEIQLVSDYFTNCDDSNDCNEYWACVITEKRVPQTPFAPRIWTTELGFEHINADEAEISCVLSYSDKSGHIGPVEAKPFPSIPRIIQNIISDNKIKCTCGSDIPSDTARAVEKGQWSELWTRILSDGRELPYIIVNCFSDKSGFLVEPQKLAYSMCSNALVFYPDSIDSSAELITTFPRYYSCEKGYVRCYVPHCNPQHDKDSYRHRFITADEIAEFGEDGVIDIFRRALVQNIEKYTDLFRIDNVKRIREVKKREQIIQNIHNKYQTILIEQKATIEKSAEDLLEEAINQQEQLERERDEALLDSCRLEEELKRQRNQVFALSAQVESMRVDAEKGRALAKSEQARSVCCKMEDLDDVVLYFEIMYADRLVFTESAKKSIKACSLEISELWNWLFSLAEYMFALFSESEAGIEKRFKELTGIECGRGEGSQTRKDKKLMKQFFTEYEGETINVEMHLKSKNRLNALHFGFSHAKQKLIIDHCGEHLTNSLTRTR